MPKFSFIVFILGLICLSFLSAGCKKSWVCSCTFFFSDEVDIVITNANKKDAEEVCKTRAEQPLFRLDVKECTLEGKYKKIK